MYTIIWEKNGKLLAFTGTYQQVEQWADILDSLEIEFQIFVKSTEELIHEWTYNA